MKIKFDKTHTQLLEMAKEELLRAFPNLLALYVFGTFATKYERKDSDIDLAILGQSPIDVIVLWNLAQQIASHVNKDVDLIDLATSSTIFRYQIITSGTRFYCSDIKQCDVIENDYMSMYLRFKEERALWTM